MIFLCIFYIQSFISYLGKNYLSSSKNNFSNLEAFQTLQLKTRFHNKIYTVCSKQNTDFNSFVLLVSSETKWEMR